MMTNKENSAVETGEKMVLVPHSVLWAAVAALERSERHVTSKQKSDAAEGLRLAARKQGD